MRFRAQYRMIRYGERAATEGHAINNARTAMAISWLEKQVKDPKLVELLRPESKCKSNVGGEEENVLKLEFSLLQACALP